MVRNKGKTRVVKNEGRRDGKKPPRSHVSYVDIEQVKQRYGGRSTREPRKELHVFGEEEPQNVKKKEHRGVYLLLLGLVLAGIAIGFYFALIIDRIEVVGNEKLERGEVLTISGLNIGEHMLFANLGEARSRLLSSPYIRSAYIKRAYPDKLIITREERKPVAAIVGVGSYALIDLEGSVMEIAQTNDKGLVAVYGVSSGGYAVGQKIGDYAEFNSETLLEIIAVLSNQGMLDIIESIDMSQPLKIGMTTTYGYTVNIGQPENLTGKLENLPPVLSKVLSMGLEGGTIDLGVLGDPVYSPPEVYQPETEGQKGGDGEGGEAEPDKAEEGGTEQPPQVAAHVVRPDREVEGAVDIVLPEDPAECGNAAAGSPEGIHVNAQCDGFHVVQSRLNSPDLIASERKKSSVVSIDFSSGMCGSQSRNFFALRMLGTRCWTS